MTNQNNQGLLSVLNSIDSGIAKVEVWIMALGVIMMAVNTVANVISRFIFNHSIIFSEELNSIFILLVTFAGIGYAARQGRHIRMSALYDILPFRQRKWLMTLICAITGLCMLLLAWYSAEYIFSLAKKGRVMPALGIKIYITYLWVPLGFAITAIQYFLACYKNIVKKEIYLSTNLKESQAVEL